MVDEQGLGDLQLDLAAGDAFAFDPRNPNAGFRYNATEGERFELPGLWLSSEELYALLASQQLLARTGGGMSSSGCIARVRCSAPPVPQGYFRSQ